MEGGLGKRVPWTAVCLVLRRGPMKTPAMMKVLLCWLADRLGAGDRLQRPSRPPPGDEKLVFITDAKAENGRAWIGGAWFLLEVIREWAPWAVSKDSPNEVIALLELLATLIAVKLWVPESRDRQVSKLAIRGYMENQSNEALVKKAMTTKFRSALVLLELAEELAAKSCALGLT